MTMPFAEPKKNCLTKGRILIVDDEPDIGLLFSNKLHSLGYQVDIASNISDALKCAERLSYSAILLDLFLGSDNSLAYLHDFFGRSPNTKIVILTGNGRVDYAVNAMNRGASGFLLKTESVDLNVEKFIDITSPRRKFSDVVDLPDLGIIGQSQRMIELYKILDKIKGTDSTVLIEGESGTGKELCARALHKMSNRSQGQFIAINCAAISETILESELFGYKKGAFTDAKQDRKGYFQTCSDGTLFLDEIGEMSPSLQSKLLRVLQEKEVTPVGSCRPIPVNTRIVAATNRNLKKEVSAHKFREDLFYRLAVLRLEMPPLRQRKDDVPLLVDHFVKVFSKKFDKHITPLTAGIYTRLKDYGWPGNVRELQNAVERGVVLESDGVLSIEDLLPHCEAVVRDDEESPKLSELPLNYQAAKDMFEKYYITNLLSVTKGNITEAARVSGQYRPNVYRLINKFHIDPHPFKYEQFH